MKVMHKKRRDHFSHSGPPYLPPAGRLTRGPLCFSNRKQRRKLHDRLRQSVKNKRNKGNACSGHNQASSTRGRKASNLPLQDLQLVNVCWSPAPAALALIQGVETIQQTAMSELTHTQCTCLVWLWQQCRGTNVHAAEEETETTFSSTKYASAGHEATTFTRVSSSQRCVHTPHRGALPRRDSVQQSAEECFAVGSKRGNRSSNDRVTDLMAASVKREQYKTAPAL